MLSGINWLSNWIDEQVGKLLPRREPDLWVEVYPDGFLLVRGRNGIGVPWKEITEVVAYKADLITVDTICFEIGCADGRVGGICEEVDGFGEFSKALELCLPGFDKGWYEKIVQPPMAENATVVFSRSGV